MVGVLTVLGGSTFTGGFWGVDEDWGLRFEGGTAVATESSFFRRRRFFGEFTSKAWKVS